jgi:hypothetical protein
MTVQAIALRPRFVAIPRRLTRLRRPSDALIWFWSCLVAYLALAFYVTLIAHSQGLGQDGVSRVAIANRILFSNDPHLAAVGFVWSPLPELVLVPLVALKSVWPALVQEAFAGNIVSALFMAGAAYQVFRFLEEVGVRRWVRWLLTATFALHPMIVLYAINSMSEAMFIFFLLLVARHLQRWLRTQEISALVSTAFYLAVLYLTRYEATAAAAAVVVIVAFATFMRTVSPRRGRLRAALLDSVIVIAPFATAFALWALTSWLITGTAFQQLSSTYGNAAQLQSRGLSTSLTLGQELSASSQALHWMFALEPFLPVVVLACAAVIVWRRDWIALAAPAVLGAVLAFMFWAQVSGSVLRLLRYFIVVIPLVILMVGITLGRRSTTAAAKTLDPEREQDLPRRMLTWLRTGATTLAAVVGIVLMSLSVQAGYRAVMDPTINVGYAAELQALVQRGPLTQAERLATLRFVTDHQVSQYIDSLHLGRGTVLVDDFLGFDIVMSSSNTQQYVITSDRDFQQVLADPADNGVRYFLVPSEQALGKLDAINRAYPGAYATGGGLGTLVKQFNSVSDDATNWRLYRVTGSG